MIPTVVEIKGPRGGYTGMITRHILKYAQSLGIEIYIEGPDDLREGAIRSIGDKETAHIHIITRTES